MVESSDIQRICELLRDAECVLIAAGAGLSADAGLDYTDKEAFTRRFPALARRGFTMKAELIGYTGWSPAVMWGYLAIHVNDVRFQAPAHPVYLRLLDLVKEKDYFVITTNVDGMFFKSGFAEDRVFTPQGDYALMQCQKPCRNDTWPTRPVIDRILPAVDPSNQQVTDPDVIPSCPNCGGPVFMNVRAGRWFVEDPYEKQRERFASWVRRSEKSHLLVIEIGSGFNTPAVIRWPVEHIVHAHPNAHLVRVNLEWPQVPQEILDKSVRLQCRAMTAVTAVWEAMGTSDDQSNDNDGRG